MKVYMVGDRLTVEERRELGVQSHPGSRQWVDKETGLTHFVGAYLLGEFRKPRAGEWYLSGALPEAFRAAADLDAAYQICRLAVFRQRTIIERVTVPGKAVV